MKTKFTNEDLIEFLYLAKLKTFSSGAEPIRKSDGGKIYLFEKGNFKYLDKYYGNIIDGGQEVVWYENEPIWIMSYRGGMLSHEDMAVECFSFLINSLQKMPKDFPVRGPEFYESSSFKYINSIEGNILNFTGKEIISLNDENIYFRDYLGGLVKLNKAS